MTVSRSDCGPWCGRNRHSAYVGARPCDTRDGCIAQRLELRVSHRRLYPEPLGTETAALDTRREFEGNDVSGSTENSVLDHRRNGGTSAGVCHGRTDRDDQTWLRTCVSRVGRRVPNSARGLARVKVPGDMVISLSCMCCKEKPALQQKCSQSRACCWWMECVSTHTATYEELMVLWKTIVLPMSSLMYQCYFPVVEAAFLNLLLLVLFG